MKRKLFAIFTGLAFAYPLFTQAQTIKENLYRPLGTATPFLTFTPDARRAGMGEAGVASSADANSAFWNIAQLPFADKKLGASTSYTPWLRDLVDDMAFINASIYKKTAKDQVLGLSLTYFNEGKIEFTNAVGQSNGTYQSGEFAITGSYARKLSKYFAMGINLRFINSDLVGGAVINNVVGKVGTSVAGDIAAYYTRDYASGKDKDKGTTLSFGAVMSNLGGKITYYKDPNFLPANLKIGGGFTKRIDAHNRFTYLLDFNKLLVPTPPIRDANGVIVQGKSTDRGVIDAIFSSFGDAPGGFSEEIKEFSISTGMEYWYNDLFAARAGYFFESESKGNRKYFTAGLGLRFKDSYGIDLAYLIPSGSNSPLANTWRISLIFNLEAKKVVDTTPITPTEDKPDN
jgi:Type IX secretion system protein PorV